MSDETENLNLPYIMPNQAQKHVTHNEAIRLLDALVQLSVASQGETSPPAAPAPGARYIVAPGGQGAWAGWDASVAYYVDGAWTRLVPQPGWLAWVQDPGEMRVWSGSAWIAAASSSGAGAAIQNATYFGLGTTANETAPLAAKLNAALLTARSRAEGGDGSLLAKLNKERAEDDAALAFQTGYGARALFGLLGNDDLSLKVSPDGASYLQALSVAQDSGNVAIGTDADANNRLVVSGQNALFTNSASLNVVMNKGADGDDLAFALQSGFATQALLGLLGGRDFTIKVGADYTTALVIDNAGGCVTLPRNPSFSATTPDDLDVPADTWVTAVFDSVRHNVGDHFDPATGVFTAPVDGSYLFGASVIYKQGTGTPDQLLLGFSINGETPVNDRKSRTDGALITQKTGLSLTASIYLLKSQTVEPMVRLSSGDGIALGFNTGAFWGVLTG